MTTLSNWTRLTPVVIFTTCLYTLCGLGITLTLPLSQDYSWFVWHRLIIAISLIPLGVVALFTHHIAFLALFGFAIGKISQVLWHRKIAKLIFLLVVIANSLVGLGLGMIRPPVTEAKAVECEQFISIELRVRKVVFREITSSHSTSFYLFSQDGGQNWKQIAISHSAWECNNLHDNGAVMWFWTSSEVYATQDKGATWHVWKYGQEDQFSFPFDTIDLSFVQYYSDDFRFLDDVEFSDGVNGEMRVFRAPNCYSLIFTNYYTNDSGRTWTNKQNLGDSNVTRSSRGGC